MDGTPYKIYDASAGSGKTYTLVKSFLKRVLAASNRQSFRNILAITFTNKAVNELKSRILLRLFDFTKDEIPEGANSLFMELQKELGLDETQLKLRSSHALKEILHNYAFFDISTIDKFTHRVIRTFARDLGLSYNFDVLLDTEMLIDEAVARVIAKAGDDALLSEALVNFALEKADDEKSWDISYDLQKIGKIVFQEQHYHHLEALKGKGLKDFKRLKSIILKDLTSLGKHSEALAAEALQIIDDSGLDHADFPRSSLPNHFKKIAAGSTDLDGLYGNQLESKLKEGVILKANIALPHTSLPSRLYAIYSELKPLQYKMAFLRNIYQTLVPLTLLGAIREEADIILEEKNQLPIARFNAVISKEIKDQPVPFIYERLGEVYRHYLIDEFQDTSSMQWDNLQPLIDNALEGLDDEGKQGSLTLVGDVKQAIYRWRGGEPEQFLDLITKANNPFTVSPEHIRLEVNYRSFDRIIAFNNDFFQHVTRGMSDSKFKHLYDGQHEQEPNHRKGGLVSLKFLEIEESGEREAIYGAEVLKTIRHLREKGYGYSDLCILVRKNKEGQFLASHLAAEEIPVISSESLLLKNNPAVQFLVNLLQYSVSPSDRETRFKLLYFLARDETDKHGYYTSNLDKLSEYFKGEFEFDIERIARTTVYDGLEYAIRQFGLSTSPSAYLHQFMEEVHRVGQLEDTSVDTFLSHWKNRQEKLSINAPDKLEAVTIMTIHKSKGLEFPVVIFPFANSDLHDFSKKKMWLPVPPEDYGGFDRVLVKLKKEIADYPQPFPDAYFREQQRIELDAVNLLYVALTRAVRALYIVTEANYMDYRKNLKQNYPGLFYNYLVSKGAWTEDKNEYVFGDLPKPVLSEENEVDEIPLSYIPSFKDRPAFRPVTQSGMLWDTPRKEALERGDLIHHALGFLKTPDDLDTVLSRLQIQGDASEDEARQLAETIQRLVAHPVLAPYYREGLDVRNETTIIGKNGVILRPDRLVIQGQNATIIEYKTGAENPGHHQQLRSYAEAIAEMGYRIDNRYLVYIDEEITIKKIE